MLVFWLVFLFLFGTCVGSFLNVCIHRMPLEKSLLWPGSHCSHCLQAIRWYDNLPLLSYWLLRGRCRTCKTRFSIRYFLIELLTGLAFAGLFYYEIVANGLDIPALKHEVLHIGWRWFPSPVAWAVFGYHAVLISLLIVATFCDLDHREIPLGITMPGTILGLAGAVLWAWPWPTSPGQVKMPMNVSWWQSPVHPEIGLVPWPVWGPLPEWLPPGSWQLGLATGVAGLLVGTVMLRVIRYLFGLGLGIEALGLGDADLMMMGGAFIGWQPITMAFFIGVFAGLFFGIAQVLLHGDNALPFGPALAIGVVVSLLFWHAIGPQFQALYFNDVLLLALGGISAALLLISSYVLRLLRIWRGDPPDGGNPA
jgi:leader peptidase (prepilin peptidase)/N-methyltransferase